MCGRYTVSLPPQEVARYFGVTGRLPNFAANYNVAPTQSIPVVRPAAEGNRELVLLRWGLIPHWAKDEKIGYSTINAKAETIDTKPTFRDAFKSRRCLVVADGFYEWKKPDAPKGHKQPFRIVLKSGEPIGFAGLWARWKSPKGETIESATIVTGEPNELIAPIHDRMPMILEPTAFERWLNPDTPADELKALLRSYPADRMRTYPVTPRMGSPSFNEPACIEPLVP